MQKLIPVALTVTLLQLGTALAQTTSPTMPSPTAPPPARVETPAAAPSNPTTDGATLTLTETEAKTWVDKVVYSSDDKNLGEVVAFARDGSNKVTELHADIGGFLGMGETRVRVMPGQFRLQGDRVILNMTAEQARTLPKIAK